MVKTGKIERSEDHLVSRSFNHSTRSSQYLYLHFGLQARQVFKLLTQPRSLLTNPAMSFVKCVRAARRSRAKRLTVCSKLPVKMADSCHIATYLLCNQVLLSSLSTLSDTLIYKQIH